MRGISEKQVQNKEDADQFLLLQSDILQGIVFVILIIAILNN